MILCPPLHLGSLPYIILHVGLFHYWSLPGPVRALFGPILKYLIYSCLGTDCMGVSTLA